MKSHPKVITEQILDLMTAIINNANAYDDDKLETWSRVKMEWTLTQVMVDRYIEERDKNEK